MVGGLALVLDHGGIIAHGNGPGSAPRPVPVCARSRALRRGAEGHAAADVRAVEPHGTIWQFCPGGHVAVPVQATVNAAQPPPTTMQCWAPSVVTVPQPQFRGH